MNREQAAYTAQATRFFRIWQRFQERNGVVSKSYSSALSLLELSVLIETQISPARSGSDLARVLNVSALTVSRALTRLEHQGLVRRPADPDDARMRRTELTDAGARLLNEIDLEANQRLERMNPRVSAAELRRLVKLLTLAAHGFPIRAADGRPIDHPLRPAIRTFTRGLGHLGGALFESDALSTFEWHVLTAIEHGGGTLCARDLIERFDAQSNSVSVLLQRLEKRGLIRRVQGKDGDQREKLLQLLPKGERTLANILRSGSAVFERTMQTLSPQEAGELCDLMEHFVGQHPQQRVVSIPVVLRPLPDSVHSSTPRVGIFIEDKQIGEIVSPDIRSVSPEAVLSALSATPARKAPRSGLVRK